ncbi:MAG: carbohydrate binding family 9 domain-containing protein, partial [Gammaproteobacteria bacterium]|nr:carbohydrate binding family 9 domain-containing protein [Gammaproteobacteria bacterium]
MTAVSLLAAVTLPAELTAQDLPDTPPPSSVTIVRLLSTPVIDGEIGDGEWQGAALIDRPFYQFQPEFGQHSEFRTVIRIAQSGTALLIAIEAMDPDIDRLSVARTQRDGGLGGDDSVQIMLDTFGDDRTAYSFQVNALGTQKDERIADNGRTVDDRWDAAWKSAALRLDDRWTVEMEIPFSELRFPSSDKDSWGINIRRTIPRNRESSTWAYPGEAVYRVSSFGELAGIQPPSREDTWTFIPYALVSFEKDADVEYQAGMDIRWRPSSRFGVDLTVNPDFALIEADVETINLSRFELRIDEKRPFFLEGNELYQQRIEQFYSRRIGDIGWGAKTNGKFDATDFSAIATSADYEDENGRTTQADYLVARFQQGFERGSNVGVLATNRHLNGDDAGSAGLDTTWFFTPTLGLTAQYLKVHGPTSDNGTAWFLRPSWDTARSHFHIRHTQLDAGIRDDFNSTGFMRDDDRKEWDTNLKHEFWFDEGPFERVEPWVNYNRYTNQAGLLRSWKLDAGVDIRLRNFWEIELDHMEEFKLFEKEFRNDRTRVELEWDARDGRKIYVYSASGFNFDSDLKLHGAGFRWPLGDKLRFEYS